jgi:hypothetical protein
MCWGAKRHERIAISRHYLYYDLFAIGWNYAEIARACGKTHGAVRHGVKHIKDMIECGQLKRFTSRECPVREIVGEDAAKIIAGLRKFNIGDDIPLDNQPPA